MSLPSNIKVFEDLINEKLQNKIKVLDLGCGLGEGLFYFEKFGFQKLIGIDTSSIDYESAYLNYFINNYKSYPGGVELKKRFQQKFVFNRLNINDYKFESNEFDFVVCSLVLHFFKPQERIELINRIFDCLAPGGMFYIKINHSKNILIKRDVEDGKAIEISKNVFQAKNNLNRIFYLVEEDEIKSEIGRFNLLLEEKNDKIYFYLLQKPLNAPARILSRSI